MRNFSFEGNEVALSDVLDAREKRAALQQQWLAQYQCPLLSLTLLAVGGVKKNPLLDYVFERALAALKTLFEELDIAPLAQKIQPLQTGHEALFVLPISAQQLKSAVINLEDFSPLSRLWDLDVIAADGTLLSRTQSGFSPRPCLLCEDNAKICARSRKHSMAEIQAEMHARVFADFVAQTAYRALLTEARLTPKPGLVDSHNNGAHRDMNLQTFEQSAVALRPFFAGFVRFGMGLAPNAQEVLAQIRPLGLQAEQAMLAATHGVNTHKGSIFAFGLVCAAIGYIKRSQQLLSVDSVCDCVATWCRGITAELESPKDPARLTAGERLYRQFGLTGARGEAEGGFAIIRKMTLPLLERHANLATEHRLLLVLLTLLAINQDTNIAHRGGIDALHWVQAQAQAAIQQQEYWQNSTALKGFLSRLDRACIERNLSAGGSADLLALTWFFAEFFGQKI